MLYSYLIQYNGIVYDMEHKKIMNKNVFNRTSVLFLNRTSVLLCRLRDKVQKANDIDKMKLFYKKLENFVLRHNEFCGFFTVFVGFSRKV